jgi:nucleoside-diphosphate-sugar epimerase
VSKIVITGGSGFIGRYFVEKFIGHNVLLFDIRKPDYSSHANYFCGDVRNPSQLNSALEGADMVIHLAAMHHDFGIADQEYFDTNVQGAENVAAAAAKHNIRKIINFSSVAVYGALGNPGPTHEGMTPAPASAYGHSKLQAEKVFEKLSEETAVRIVNIRSTVVFGAFNLANVLNLIKAIDAGIYFHVGKGNNIKSIAYVENIVDASLFALSLRDSGFDTFNYVDEPTMSSREIANLQARLLGKKIRFSLPLSLAVFMAIPFDLFIALSKKNIGISSKRVKKFCTQTWHGAEAIRKAGFKPTISIEDGMARMIHWYQGTKKNL